MPTAGFPTECRLGWTSAETAHSQWKESIPSAEGFYRTPRIGADATYGTEPAASAIAAAGEMWKAFIGTDDGRASVAFLYEMRFWLHSFT